MSPALPSSSEDTASDPAVNFSKIPFLTVWMPSKAGEGKEQSVGWVVSLPDSNVLVAIDSLLEILEEISESHRQDFEVNRSILTSTDFLARGRLAKRETWRFGSYCLFALNTLGVLKHLHEQTRKNLSATLQSAWGDRIHDLDENISPCKEFSRHKVFSHAAYWNPWDPKKKEEDTLSTQWTSLQYLSAKGYSMGPEGIAFGGFTICVGDQPCAPVPKLTFSGLETEFRHQFSEWHKLFCELSAELFKLPDEHFKKVFQNTDARVERMGSAPI